MQFSVCVAVCAAPSASIYIEFKYIWLFLLL